MMKNILSFNLFEGRTFKVAKKKQIGEGEMSLFRDKIEGVVKSKGCSTKKVGSDLEVVHKGDHIGDIMFRSDYVGVKKTGNKFTDKFQYNELGKIKSKIGELVK